MKKTILLVALTLIVSGTQSLKSQKMKSVREQAKHRVTHPKTLDEVKQYALGEWKSIAIELRPTEDRAGSGKIQPTYLKRNFSYQDNDTFVGTITMFADNYGQMPLLEFEFRGDLNWGKEHPIAEGAWTIDYVLNQGLAVTPLHEQAAKMLNTGLPEGIAPFEVGVKKDILGKAFPMFNIAEGQIVSDYDLIYFKNGLLFMGAKHVDGTPFDQPERRPHQLQIPLEKVY